jgi:hypothetical protein
MLRYRRGVFQVGRGARGFALGGVLSCALLGYFASAGAAGYKGNIVVPSDGRLNMPAYNAKVTAVAWPPRNGAQEPTPGRRFVSFTLEVSAPSQSASPTSPSPSLAAALEWDSTSNALSLSSIDDELQAGAGGSSDSASASYMASVPNDTHDVDLVLTEGTFSQSFDLWTLSRVPPSPAVLYRAANQTSLTGTAAGAASLSLSNPSDGFNDSATVTLQSATLGFFAPPGTTLSPGPDQAVLSVVLDGQYPNEPNDPTGSGHYLGSTAPLPADMLNFTPSGGSAAPATLSDPGDPTGEGNADDGLFDATYSFLVPATVTSGTLQVAAGSFTGAEFTLYTAESGMTTLDVAAPATISLSFPALAAQATQSKPPWVGQPDPPTSAATSATRTSGGSSTSPGFPIWVAIVVLVILATAAVLIERRRRSRMLATFAATADATTGVVDPTRARSSVPVVAETETEGAGVPGPAAIVERENVTEPARGVEPVVAAVVSTDIVLEAGAALNVLGARQVLGVEIDTSWALLTELFTYLVFHDHRHLKAAQIGVGLRPSGSRDLDEKTVRNALTKLRRSIGPEHLPEGSTLGYLIVEIACDWVTFQRCNRQADTTGGEEAIALRKEALALVRGAPFADVNDEWIDAERLRSHMVVAIVKSAQLLAADLLEVERPSEAEEAASAGLRGAPRHFVLWELGAWAICDQSDRGRLELWMVDAKANLDDEDYARLERSVADHRGPSA